MKVRFRILDVVALTRDISERGLVRGQVGTVIEQLNAETFEVEFIDNNGKAYNMAALSFTELIALRHGPTGSK